MNKFSIINDEDSHDEVDTIFDPKQRPYISTDKTFDKLVDISSLVKSNISTYLNLNIDDLLYKTDAAIFGGAVRDSIAGLEIHDVDILALPMSAKLISNRLKDYGFKLLHLTSVDLALLYKGIQVIYEPWTFIKNNAIVQIIRPAGNASHYSAFQNLLSNVDISACGVAYGLHWLDAQYCVRNGNLVQVCNNAIAHCECKVFKVYSEHAMYQRDRIMYRIEKLVSRGWTQIDEK